MSDIIFIGNPIRFEQAYSTAAQDYINRVIAADVAAGNNLGLERGVQNAYASFIDGLISDGLIGVSNGVISQASSLIKAACIECAAQTMAGALVPLVGPAPTKFGTESGWIYNRKTGLSGNGTNNYLNSNRNHNEDPQNDCSAFCYRTRTSTINQVFIGARSAGTSIGSRYLWHQATPRFTCNPSTDTHDTAGSDTINIPTFQGVTRGSNTSTTGRISNTSYNFTRPSAAPISNNIRIHCGANGATNELFSTATIAFYGLGRNLELSLVNSRLLAFMSDISQSIF
jgi:hypothetical protein